MATETGFAADQSDLLAKLRTFALANGATSLRYDTSVSGEEELILQLPGAGTDAIIFGMKGYNLIADDLFGWFLQGFTGFSSSLIFNEQPGAIPLGSRPPCLALHKNNPSDPNTIKYWFIINGRRIIVVGKIGSTYQQAYMGFILPYSIPTQWPYPLMVGGSTTRDPNSFLNPHFDLPYRFSETTWNVAPFWYNRDENGAIGTVCIREPGGVYLRFKVQNQSISDPHNGGYTGTWPYLASEVDTYRGFKDFRNNLDGTYTLQPIMYMSGATTNIYGELDGVKHVSGFSNAAENTVTVGGDSWLVVPAVFRNDIDQFAAIKLV